MKAFLMFRDRDFNPKHWIPPNAEDLMQDLELETLLDAMALGDKFVHDIERVALLTSVNATTDEIQYRQHIMVDSLDNAGIVVALYDLAVEALTREREATFYSFYRESPGLLVSRSIDILRVFIGILHRLRTITYTSSTCFRSEGFQRFFIRLQHELNDDFFQESSQHLRNLKFSAGLLAGVRLGAGNKGVDYILRDAPQDTRIWPLRLLPMHHDGYTLHVHPRDEAGAQVLVELRNRALAPTARALAQSVDHILGFFQMLRTELAFYIGGINLYQRLREMSLPTAFPRARSLTACCFNTQGIYDVCLALSLNKSVIGNDVKADHKSVVMITGANHGGKSTFLRSVGLAQLMMQAGLFVAAKSFEASVAHGIVTHYKREEDNNMMSGKFDEELRRMSALVDMLKPGAMILFNESFASTNEREGSEIASQIVCALRESGVKIFFVTHLYQFAHAEDEKKLQGTLFLRAERLDDGTRTYKLAEGRPLDTSFGKDLYSKICSHQ